LTGGEKGGGRGENAEQWGRGFYGGVPSTQVGGSLTRGRKKKNREAAVRGRGKERRIQGGPAPFPAGAALGGREGGERRRGGDSVSMEGKKKKSSIRIRRGGRESSHVLNTKLKGVGFSK